jgi:Protein of unknown function (DUF1759)
METPKKNHDKQEQIMVSNYKKLMTMERLNDNFKNLVEFTREVREIQGYIETSNKETVTIESLASFLILDKVPRGIRQAYYERNERRKCLRWRY